jgi:hypothetical protein
MLIFGFESLKKTIVESILSEFTYIDDKISKSSFIKRRTFITSSHLSTLMSMHYVELIRLQKNVTNYAKSLESK